MFYISNIAQVSNRLRVRFRGNDVRFIGSVGRGIAATQSTGLIWTKPEKSEFIDVRFGSFWINVAPQHDVSAALAVLAVAANAQNNTPTIEPNDLNVAAEQKPPLQLSDQQRREIQDALVTAHSAQKAPDRFEAKAGVKIPTKLKVDAMPAPLINKEPVLMQYGFVKLENDLLVVDPMNSTVVAVIPRKFPKKQTMQGIAPSGQTSDPASQGDEAETSKKR